MGFIIVTVIGIVIGITRWRKHSSSCGVGVTQNELGMDDVVQLTNPNINHPIHPPVDVAQSANAVPPGEGQIQPPVKPAQDGQERNRNQNLDAIQSHAEVAQNEQEIYQHANSHVILPMNPIQPPVKAPSANVPPTGEGDVQPPVQPAHDVQEKDAIPPTPPPEDDTPPPANTREAATNNQLSDRVGDGSVQLHRLGANSDSPTLDKEKHFVPALKASVQRHQSQERLPFNVEPQSQATIGTQKPRRGSRSSHDDPDVRRGSVPAPLSPLVHGFSASPQSPRSPNKKRRVSISSFSSKRQSQIEDGEETIKLLEPPKTPRGPSLSSKRQSKSATDEKTNLLEEPSPVDDEHLPLGDGHTSDA